MRSALERRENILSILRIRRVTTCTYLAREFKVSMRTICSDIQYLSLNHMIRTETGGAGGIFYDGKSGNRQEYLTPRQSDCLRELKKKTEDNTAEIISDILQAFSSKSK